MIGWFINFEISQKYQSPSMASVFAFVFVVVVVAVVCVIIIITTIAVVVVVVVVYDFFYRRRVWESQLRVRTVLIQIDA